MMTNQTNPSLVERLRITNADEAYPCVIEELFRQAAERIEQLERQLSDAPTDAQLINLLKRARRHIMEWWPVASEGIVLPPARSPDLVEEIDAALLAQRAQLAPEATRKRVNVEAEFYPNDAYSDIVSDGGMDPRDRPHE